MAASTIQLPDWKSLYETAVYARDLAPWNWMFEDEIFGIRLPEQSVTWYCSIMGIAGEHTAYCFYEGEQGLDFHLTMRDMDLDAEDAHEKSYHAMVMQKCMQVSFEDSTMIDPLQKQMIKKMGLTFNGKSKWVSLLDYSPGWLPWFIEDDQVNLLHTLLETAVFITKKKRENPEWFGSWDHSGADMPVFTVNGAQLEETIQKVAIRTLQAPALRALTFPDEWDALQQLPVKNELMICGTYHTMSPIQDEPDSRPFFAVIRLFVHPGNGRILGMVSSNPYQPEFEEQELLHFFRQLNFRPTQILVSDQDTSRALQSGCERAGIAQAVNQRAKEIMDEVTDALRKMGAMR